MLTGRLNARAAYEGLHGRDHIRRQRRTALILVVTGLLRVAVWIALILMYVVGVHFTKSLFLSVAFVAVISLYANAATDFGQVCASLAQLTAGDAHKDAETARVAVAVDFAQVDSDIARLAVLQPGPEAEALAAEIRQRIGQT